MQHSIIIKGPYINDKKWRGARQGIRYFCDGWRLVAVAVALGVVLPLGVIFSYFLEPDNDVWRHLVENLLADVLINTAILVVGVIGITFVLGVSLAWLTAVCDFPGRKIFSWALLLPMAMPTYVLAFVMLGLLDFSGPVQTFVRQWAPTHKMILPNVRSAGGVIAVMALGLYPYVYLLARSAFKTQGKRVLEAAQTLGCNQTTAFVKVALPMARPWIAGGLLLVLMETLADFGAVSIFNYDTFTTAIYKAWFGFFSLSAAAQLSAVLVLIVFVVLMVEQKSRSKMQFTQSGRAGMQATRIRLTGWQRWLALVFALAVLLVGFLIPFGQLIVWSGQIFSEEFNDRYLGYLGRSLLFAFLATIVIGGCALLLSYAQRHRPDNTTRMMIRVSTLGYALPGTVLAVGIFSVISGAGNLLADLTAAVTGFNPGAFMQGTILTVIAAYLVRYMAVGFNSINSAMYRITPHLDEAAVSLGVTGLSLLKRVHLPLLRNGLLTASMLVFVDVMKEMPMTLMTRPFGWDTLAVKIFELTSEGEWERAALPAVALVLGGLLPVVILTRQTEKQPRNHP